MLSGMKLPDIAGRAVRPGDPGWDDARRSWNLSVDQHPAAVVEAAGAADVQALLRAGLRVAPQSTGHGSEALGPLDDVVLLKTSRLRDVGVRDGVLRAGAGVLAAEAAAAAGAQRLAPVLGLAPTVGVAGLTLAGGTGWLSRAYGLACNNVRAFEVVLASGELVRVDADREPDLFWALRGGGGRGAVVTALELAAHPVAEVSAGMLAWPVERAEDVFEQFRRWTFEAPAALGTVLRVLSLPPVDAVPEPLRGRRIVAVVASYLGPEADARRAIEPLRSGGALVDTFAPLPPEALPRVAGDPEEPIPARGDGLLLNGLPPLDALLDDAFTVLELRLLGGALGRAPDGAGALARLDGAFSLFAGAAAPDADAAAAFGERAAALRARLAPWIAGELLSSSRAGLDAARAFDAPTWERLCAVRDAYDPERRIVVTAEDAGVRPPRPAMGRPSLSP
jgi:FAD binding domain